jgi:F0F1-type ATP synthase delta subunit
MAIARHIVAATLAKQSLGQVNAPAFAQEIAAYLLTEHRTSELESLIRDIMQYRADHGIVEVIATSAHPLTPAISKDIEVEARRVFVDAKKIIISPVHDETVIGGVKLVLANQQLDLSVQGKLNRFKQLTATGKE